MEEVDKDDNIFIVAWDMLGLETIVDAHELQSEDVMRALQDQKGSKLGEMLFYLTMRARSNMHRKYEIYSIHTTPEVTKDSLASMFEENPQAAADLIRARGNKIYSDREASGNQVIR
jgi:hypothetical protein